VAPPTDYRELAKSGVLVQEAGDLGTLRVTGGDAKSWLNGLVTCNLAPLSPGEGTYGFAVAKTGKVLSPVYVVAADACIFVGAPASSLGWLRDHMNAHLIMEAAELADAPEFGWLLAHGPRAHELVPLLRGRGAEVAAVDSTGLGGIAATMPQSGLAAARDAVLEHAAGWAALAAPDAWEPLRIELGIPRFGVDFSTDNYPQEASLERIAVSFDKGCYLGQETVFMLQMRGHVKKKLVQLAIDGAADVEAAISSEEGADIGAVTSAVVRDGRTVALGYVKYKFASVGTVVAVAGSPARVIGDGPGG
jgi:folate-binding protein YgfZ